MNKIAENVYTCDTEHSVMGLSLGGRMTVLQLESGLLLHSPVDLSPDMSRELETLGKVRWIVAPSLYHHLFAGIAAERWPEATLLGAPGLDRKRPDLDLQGLLSAGSDRGFLKEVELCPLRGMPDIQETLLFHPASNTLLVTDLFFHFDDKNHPGFMTSSYLRLAGAWGGLRTSRLFRSAVKDRDAFRRSLQPLLEWEIHKVIPCHGRPKLRLAEGELREALSWIL